MPKNWKTYKLEELLTVLTDYHANGAYKKLKANVTLLEKEDYAVMIRTTNFERNNFEDLIYVDEHAYNFLSKSNVYPSDILMNKIANAGSIYQMPNLNRPVTLAMNLFLLRFNAKVNQHYLFYHLKAKEQYIKNFSAGSVTKTITKNAVRNLEFKLPPLQEQTQIANILSAIDAKIENNLAINKTLEDMAMSLYKHWFVDFGPFQNGEFVESELGLIPEGWEVKKIGDVIETLGGGTPKTVEESYWKNGEILWYSPTDLTRDNAMYSLDSSKKITDLGLQKSSAKLIPPYSLLMSSRATIGALTINTKEASTNQGFITMIPNEELTIYQLYNWSKDNLDLIISKANGSTFKEISKTNFRNLNIVIGKTIEPFIGESKYIFKKVENNIKENQSLTQLRDTLLPKLINGEVRLKEFREEVENLV